MSEYKFQKSLWQLMQQNKRDDVIGYHPANGGFRNPIEAAKFKASGVVAGVSDFALVVDARPYFLELKHGNNKLQDSQKAFQELCIKAGAGFFCAWDLPQAVNYLNSIEFFKNTVRV